MSIQITIRNRLTEAVKNRDEDGKKIYRFIKGQLDLFKEQPVTDTQAVKLLRSLYNDAKNNPRSFTPREVELLGDMVPPVLSPEDTRDYLVERGDDKTIMSCPREGQAIGIAMKAFAAGQRSVDPEVVRAVVIAMRHPS